ncbi:MAG: DUF3168 domain-containing protein [Sphingomonas sp.]
MSALAIVQAALTAALRAHAPLAGRVSGIHLGPPPRAAFPYVAIGAVASGDWSHKTARGREIRFGATLWDDDAERATALTDAVEAAVDAMPRVLAGHRIVSLVHLRTRMLRERGDGPWAGIVEYRARTLEE